MPPQSHRRDSRNVARCVGLSLIVGFSMAFPSAAVALPPADDIPEEVLRSQTILGARSPIDNQPLSPSEYEQLQAELAEDDTAPRRSPKLERLIFLLKLRKFYRSLWPF